ncbi:oligosaccharide flippase family protein [Defluviicoccus vanus]
MLSGAALTMGVKIVGAAAAFGFHVLLARQIGAEGYGQFSYVLSIAAMLSVISIFGTNVVNLKYAATYAAQREWGLLTGIVCWSIVRVSIASVAVSTTLALIVLVPVLNVSSAERTSFFLAALIVVFGSVAVAEAGILRGLRHPLSLRNSPIPARALRSLLSLATMLALMGTGVTLEQSYQALAINAVSAFAVLAVTTSLVLRALPANASLRQREYRSRQWMSTALPICLMAIAQSLQGQVDILILKHFSTIDDVGVFSAASRISLIVGFGIASISSVMSPTMAELITLNMRAELQRLLYQTSAVTFLWAISALLFSFLWGREILSLFGPDFVRGYATLLLLLSAQCVIALAGNLGMLMVLTGHQVTAGWIYSIVVVGNIGLDIILVPVFGMEGAAMASLFVALISRIGIGYFLGRREGITASLISGLWAKLCSKTAYDS